MGTFRKIFSPNRVAQARFEVVLDANRRTRASEPRCTLLLCALQSLSMMNRCYMCGAAGSTREHVPPRCFFPKGSGDQQLLTVPSCPKHNTAKSNDDQYVLAQICINAAEGDNLSKQIFQRSIAPQLVRSPAFAARIAQGSQTLPNGSRAYPVDLDRLDSFFDHLVHALVFDKYGRQLDSRQHQITHEYLSLTSNDPVEQARKDFLVGGLGRLSASFPAFQERFEAANVVGAVYEYRLFAQAGPDSSMTFRHYFYDIFEVVSLVSMRAPE
jgi:hypothetical protein